MHAGTIMDQGLFPKDDGLFPADTGELDHVVDLIIEDAECFTLLQTDQDEAMQTGAYYHLTCWLLPKIEEYGEPPECEDNLGFFPAGWPSALAELYLALRHLSFGSTWKNDADRAKSAADVHSLLTLIKSFMDDVSVDDYQALKLKLRNHQSNAGKAGMKARWGNRNSEDVDSILDTLAVRKDELGDNLPAKDLWGSFYSYLDAKRLCPEDSSGEEITNADRMTWDDNDEGISFKTFSNKISEIRKTSS